MTNLKKELLDNPLYCCSCGNIYEIILLKDDYILDYRCNDCRTRFFVNQIGKESDILQQIVFGIRSAIISKYQNKTIKIAPDKKKNNKPAVALLSEIENARSDCKDNLDFSCRVTEILKRWA
jgi:hypothetical protein